MYLMGRNDCDVFSDKMIFVVCLEDSSNWNKKMNQFLKTMRSHTNTFLTARTHKYIISIFSTQSSSFHNAYPLIRDKSG